MRRFSVTVAIGCTLAVLLAVGVSARKPTGELVERKHNPADQMNQPVEASASARAETTWIFDADFEDLTGDNYGIHDLGEPGDSQTGWYTTDRSGGIPQGIYWHKDTLYAYRDGEAPDTSMWCGTCDGTECWLYDCGYGNEWRQDLTKEVDLSAHEGDTITLRFRQQFNLEIWYDFGYLDVSADSGSNWTTELAVDNPGFGGPGVGQSWNLFRCSCSAVRFPPSLVRLSERRESQ